MKKLMNAITISTACACMAGAGYLLMRKKNKNMLDIIIEEIEAIK